MEFHKTENNILISYKRYTSSQGSTCFPASCQNDIGYIRFFFSQNTLLGDEMDLFAANPKLNDFPLSFELLDDSKTFKVLNLTSNSNGPFYQNQAECEASGINDNHLRFRLVREGDYTFREVTGTGDYGNPRLVEQYQHKVWYPDQDNGFQRICYIKISVTFIGFYYRDANYSNIKFHVVSQGDNISNSENFTFGVREFTVNANSNNSMYCAEYKCSGKLEGSNVIDYTHIKIGIRPPTLFHCHIRNIQSGLRNFTFGSRGQLNQNATMSDRFDGYAPDYYDTSFGIYDHPTDSRTEGSRVNARRSCMEKCMRNQSNPAVTLECH